ncbi:MAG: hypothetical protein CL587_02080 [Alteromonadaceae bacterium]|nr:hypothetical protein [Alteromonadaceae bacterium]
MNNINRNLISYAYLAQTSRKDGDLISGLMPIFAPIAKIHTGEKFKPAEFSRYAAELYGLKINPIAIEGLTPRLEKVGILQKFQIDEKNHEYAYAPIEQEFDEVSGQEINYLLERFIDFCEAVKKTNDTLSIDEEQLKSDFLAHIVSMDFIGVLLKPEKSVRHSSNTLSLPKQPEEVKWLEDKEVKSKVEVLCAAFVSRIFKEEPDTYNLLTRITAGALLAEVVLNFQSPDVNISLTGLRMVLDAPFLMGLLNLSSEESHEATKEICDLLKEKGAELCVFQHSIDELKGNLQAVVNAFNKKEAFGPTARRLLKQSFYAYASSMKDKPEPRILSEKIRIIEAPSGTNSYQWLTQEDQDKLFRSLGFYQNKKAQEVDTESVAGVIRLRHGYRASIDKLQTSKAIFITSNPWVADKTTQCLIYNNLLAQDETPPCMSDRTIAGLLWALYGGQSGNLPSNILLANCASTLDPKPDLIRQMHTFLADIDDNQAEYFEALMTDDRAAQYLTEATLGDSLYITDENVIQILDHMKTALVEESKVEHKRQLDAVQAEHTTTVEKLEELANSTKDEKLNIESALLTTQSELRKKAALLEEREQQYKDRIKRQLMKAVQTSDEKLDRLIMLIAIGVVFGGSALSGIIGYLTTSYLFAVIGILVSLSASVIGFWRVPDIVFGKIMKEKKTKYFNKSCSDQIIDNDWEALFEVDLSKSEVNEK